MIAQTQSVRRRPLQRSYGLKIGVCLFPALAPVGRGLFVCHRRAGAPWALGKGRSPVKPCPECGQELRLAHGIWSHIQQCACKVRFLRATEAERAAERSAPLPIRRAWGEQVTT